MERIRGVGPRDAEMALVGEAYGAEEEKYGKPFVGKTGWELDKLLHSCGIDRNRLYITNVVNERPPKNKFRDKWYSKGKPTEELQQHHIELRTELAQLPLLKKVVCLGKEATYALAGGGTELVGYWTEADWKPDVWILHTYHPSTIFRGVKIKESDGTSSTYNSRQIIGMHLMKAQTSPEYEVYYTHTVSGDPTITLAEDYILPAKGPVAVDIEVINKEIVCIGYSVNGLDGVCVDLREEYQIEGEVYYLKNMLKEKAIPKIFHNAPYDVPRLAIEFGWPVSNFWDTMVLQKSLFPDMPKSLKFCAGFHTNLPYWKDDLKTATDTNKGDIDWQQLFEYNCLDVIATHKVFTSLMDYACPSGEMRGVKITSNKFPHLWDDKKLMEATMEDIILGGINVDFKTMKEEKVLKEVESLGVKEELDEKLGINVNSPPQLGAWADKAGILGKNPKRTETGRIQMNEAVMEKLAETDETFAEIIAWKKKNKLISTYYKPTPDPTGRWHCTFNILTKTGRFSSSSSAFGNGYNLQNVPSSVRHLFVPTEGWRFCSVDLKSGDNTVFAALIGDDLELDLIRSGKDVHNHHTMQMTGLSEEEVIAQDKEMKDRNEKGKSLRQQYKMFCHAVNYGAKYTTIASNLGITRAEAKARIAMWFQIHPQTRQYHQWVAEQLRTEKHLTTPLGRRREFILVEGERVLEDAIAYIPQSTCTGVLNMGWLNLKRALTHSFIRALLQEHDGMLYEFYLEAVGEDEMVLLMKKHHVFPVDITSPLDSKTRTIEIPITVGFGDNWKEAG